MTALPDDMVAFWVLWHRSLGMCWFPWWQWLGKPWNAWDICGHLETFDLRHLRPVQVASDLTSAIVLAGVRHEARNQRNQIAHSTSCASVWICLLLAKKQQKQSWQRQSVNSHYTDGIWWRWKSLGTTCGLRKPLQHLMMAQNEDLDGLSARQVDAGDVDSSWVLSQMMSDETCRPGGFSLGEEYRRNMTWPTLRLPAISSQLDFLLMSWQNGRPLYAIGLPTACLILSRDLVVFPWFAPALPHQVAKKGKRWGLPDDKPFLCRIRHR